jgi:MFS family permease
LTPLEFGQLGSAFFLLFSASAALTGFIVNRVKTKWVVAVLAAIWALTQFPMVGQVGFGVMLISRIVLGAGEGPAFPVALHAAYKWFPNERRALPSSVLALGSAVGVFVAAPILTYIIYSVSWHAAFGMLGVVGLVWVAAWLLLAQEGPIVEHPHAAAAGAGLPYRRLLLSGTVLGTILASWAAYWGLALALTWLPTYASKVMGYSPQTVGNLTAAQWLTGGLVVFGAGALSERLKLRGVSSRACRALLSAACIAVGGLFTILMTRMDPGLPQMAVVILGFALPSVILAVGPALIGEVVPPAQRGAVLGINTALHTTAGLAAPVVMGKIVQSAATPDAGYNLGFIIAGVVALAGGLVALLLLRPEADLTRLASAAPLKVAPDAG